MKLICMECGEEVLFNEKDDRIFVVPCSNCMYEEHLNGYYEGRDS